MACVKPLLIPNKNTYGGLLPSVWSVPCSYCLNCRVDRRNELEVYCEDLECRYRSSAFVTLTYDDEHIIENNFCENQGLFSLNKVHLQNFFKRLRATIDYHQLNDNLYINRSFKYLAVGEYGEDSKRTHYHILFFGLDSRIAESLITKCWDKGNILCLPIKKGAFRYVLKYLDKQVKGSQAEELYTKQGLEKPFCVHSVNFGTQFILDNLDFILKNDCCFLGKHNKLVPIGPYYRRLLALPSSVDYLSICKNMERDNINKDNGSFYGFSFKQLNEYKKRCSLMRERSLIKQARDDLSPVDDSYMFSCSPMSTRDMRELLNAINRCDDDYIYTDIIPF